MLCSIDVGYFVGQLLDALDPWLVVLVLTVVNTVTGMLCFLLGWLCRWEWIERIFKVDRTKVERIQYKVQRYGAPAAALAWLPAVGTPIILSLGLMRTNPLLTLLFMALGKGARNAVLVLALGYSAGLLI